MARARGTAWSVRRSYYYKYTIVSYLYSLVLVLQDSPFLPLREDSVIAPLSSVGIFFKLLPHRRYETNRSVVLGLEGTSLFALSRGKVALTLSIVSQRANGAG